MCLAQLCCCLLCGTQPPQVAMDSSGASDGNGVVAGSGLSGFDDGSAQGGGSRVGDDDDDAAAALARADSMHKARTS
jgi:hypothetical protein